MHIRRDVGRKAALPRERPYVILIGPALHATFLSYLTLIFKSDVNQFSIITELLGTPPDDVIETICSENVCRRLLLIPDLEETHVCVVISL